MSLDRLQIRNFRNLAAVDLDPDPGLNWFHGENGAGKTSVLEAIHMLARGRSFRTVAAAPLIQNGTETCTIVAWSGNPPAALGVERGRRRWRGRIGGVECQRISEFARRLPLVLIEPASHRIVEGAPDARRAFLDWGMFHVEHDYLDNWRSYARLLRQRNAALKRRAANQLLAALEEPMAMAAIEIDRRRESYVSNLAGVLIELVGELEFRMPVLAVEYRPGQPRDGSLAECWRHARAADRDRGHTRHGPHRAELELLADGEPAAMRLSRGQQKLLSVLLILAQGRMLKDSAGTTPLLLLDDPVSELDRTHLERLLDWVAREVFQVWATAVTEPPGGAWKRFHVEQGGVRPVV